jgi:amino acid transporter
MNQSMATNAKARFGTFGGVFTPTALTILGLILYLRLGWVVGQAGLAGSLAIIGIACGISLFTALSLSSIATSMHVRAGGAYYMISRTLGIEIGGAIGIPLYLSQAVSVSFYIIGFAEAFTSLFPVIQPNILSTGVLLTFGVMAFVGAAFAMKVQYAVLSVLAASLVSFFLGGWDQWVAPTWFAPEAATASFWQVFAIFFPAVTGIAVGLSMSGDLKDPVKSIPLGTLSAVGVTSLVYAGAAVWLATHASTDQLINDNLIMQRVAAWGPLIVAGVWLTTLSSALGSIVAAPRTLQAMSFDGVVPVGLGSQLGSATEPRLAVLLTTALGLVVIWSGDLDFVASIITMFFLNTYAMINLTAGIERLVGNPSFRPQFRVSWFVSVLGAVGCYAAMFLINVIATIAAILLSYGVFVLLKRRSLKQEWGDIGSGAWFEAARFCLIRLAQKPWHVKNWRPNILIITSIRDGMEVLAEAGSWFSSGRGIVTFCHLIVEEVEDFGDRRPRTTASHHLSRQLEDRHVTAFTQTAIVDSLETGILTALQTHGIAGLEPNCALLAWGKDEATQIQQMRLTRKILALKKSMLLLKYADVQAYGANRWIDIWWRGRDRNAELMLMLAYLVKKSARWENSRIRLLQLVGSAAAIRGATRNLEQILQRVRVYAEPHVLIRSVPDESFHSVLQRESTDTALTFLGMARPGPGHQGEQIRELNALLANCGTAMLVRSGETENLLDTETEPRKSNYAAPGNQ